MILPDENECLILLKKHDTPSHIIEHSRMVWKVAKILGDALVLTGFRMDMDLLMVSCLLHDIAKYPCIVEGGRHDLKGGEMLEQEGLEVVARIVDQHVVLRDWESDPVKEEHVLFYADKRVVHDRIVSLRDRFVYLQETYGKTDQHMAGLAKMEHATRRLETRIFSPLTFDPEDVERIALDQACPNEWSYP